jgi:arabinogalactan oligomer/maltooligosaccharide transport system permease protein
MLTRARVLWLATLVMVAAWLLAPPVLAQPAPIRLWHAYRGAELDALQRAVGRWQGAPVELLALPHDAFAAKLSAAIPLGQGPDLFIDAHERLGDFRERGLVAPVGDAIEGDGTAFAARALEAVTLDGARYAVPLSQKCIAMYYNPALVADAPASLEAIAALAGKLPPGTFPLVYEAESAYGHAPLLGAFGGTLLGSDDSFGFIGPGAEQSLRLARQLVGDGVVPEAADGALVTQLFASGKAAVAFSGPWLASSLEGKALRYRVAPMPLVEAAGAPLRPLLTVEAVMLSPQGAARDEVRSLARLLADADAARSRMRLARTVSARRDVRPSADDAFLRAFAEQARVAQPMPTSTAMRAVWEPAMKALRKVMRGDAEPDTALNEAARRFADVRRPLPARRSPAPLMLLLAALLLAGAGLLVKRARQPSFRAEWRASLPAYRYVAHAVVALGVLVFLPLTAGAAISLFAGQPHELRYVGLSNFFEILTARGGPLLASGSFYVVLLVTVLWTVLNLALHLSIGVFLGMLLSRPGLRFRGVYRVLLIVPWAVPNYVTALAWKGMFHRQFGAVTALTETLNSVFGSDIEPIAWFARFSTAFTANVATNVWLGFPFMMVVTIAALTAVPRDVIEAASIDGADRWQRFRLVTLPIIRPTMMPAAVLGAVWTFNMFNVVFLVSGGEPDGTTDILVSEAYRWAFTRQANYGYAAAYAVLIFLLLAGATKLPVWLSERRKARNDADGRQVAALEAAT